MKIKPSDYTYMFWKYGWRGKSPVGKRVMSILAGNYGCTFDTNTASLIRFGAFKNLIGAREALTTDNEVLYKLPAMELHWHLTAGQTRYTLSSSFEKEKNREYLIDLKLPLSLLSDESPGEQTRKIVSGRFVQRFDKMNLCFESADGERLGVLGRAEVTALSDYVSIAMHIDSGTEFHELDLSACLDVGPSWTVEAAHLDPGRVSTMTLVNEDGQHFTLSTAYGCESEMEWDPETSSVNIHTSVKVLDKGKGAWLTLFLIPSSSVLPKPIEPSSITALGIAPYTGELAAEYDGERGLYWIPLPDISEHWDMEHNRDMLERVNLSIANPTDKAIRVPLVFSREGSVPGITGLTPMLRGRDGSPLGVPVQICKNWHRKAGETILYEGAWFQGYTVIEVEPGAAFDCELTIAYAQWGGVPAASHAQLCLIGYGGNQLWDQAAIGSFGESITYDPDVNLGRAIIDDVRPLMLCAKDGVKWGWTNNVGGGDFLVYFDAQGEKQVLKRMKAYYEYYGPNLTNVHYAGVSADGKIDAHLQVSTPRCDDINRSYHRFRYDVREPVEFSRLAFYQLGADGYNNHQFNLMAWGNRDGLREEWAPGKGGLRYERTGIPCEGDQAWFSLHDAIPGLHHDKFIEPQGPWANRGMIIRSWSARLGGENVPMPYASVFLTEDHVESANVELSAPPGVTTLQPGDYVECEVEYIILPMDAADYYGPNEALRRSLKDTANTWKPVHRQAAGNHLVVTAEEGTVLQSYPTVLCVNEADRAEFEIAGGISYVPVTLNGLSSHDRGCLQERVKDTWHDVDQSVHGNDFWQTEFDPAGNTWTRIYNVELDGYDNGHAVKKFRFVP